MANLPHEVSLMTNPASENTTPCFLSIIIPAFNEEKRLPDSLLKIIRFVRQQAYPVEVIVVDDGSSDRTAEVVRDFQEDAPFISLLAVEHGGKGHAVKAGMQQAKGDYLFLCDSDLSMPIDEITKFLPPALDGYDVAIASREISGARRYDEPPYRHLMGRVFNLIVRLLAVPGVQDTQAGFKCFRRQAARQLFPLQTIKGWGFDVEVLFIAQKRGLRIVEVPIHWYYMNRSRVRPVQDTYNMLREVLKVRLNDWRGRYN
jgi:dolichyl-phosphate beta-glucosyltransferase